VGVQMKSGGGGGITDRCGGVGDSESKSPQTRGD
jgi:hypothetical protein